MILFETNVTDDVAADYEASLTALTVRIATEPEQSLDLA